MSSEHYAIVFDGNIIDGHDREKVQLELAKLLKIETSRVTRIFSGKRIILKRTADKMEAARYRRALTKVGADVKIKILQYEEAQNANSSMPAPTDNIEIVEHKSTKQDILPETSTGQKEEASLMPNIGDLFDPLPVADIPDLDLTDYSLAENDSSFILEQSTTEAAHLDLSAYSLAKNDGTNLFDLAPNVTADIKAPDYALDTPGALLETLHEQKELVQPNIAGLTLAKAGAYLLKEDVKPSEATQSIPDTSGIKLVTSFDLST